MQSIAKPNSTIKQNLPKRNVIKKLISSSSLLYNFSKFLIEKFFLSPNPEIFSESINKILFLHLCTRVQVLGGAVRIERRHLLKMISYYFQEKRLLRCHV